jgi:hypothetical protein
VTTPLERILPDSGLPSWWTSRDADGDGQISMAEYASKWTDKEIQDFKKYDGNGDGFITQNEYFANGPAASSSSRR